MSLPCGVDIRLLSDDELVEVVGWQDDDPRWLVLAGEIERRAVKQDPPRRPWWRLWR